MPVIRNKRPTSLVSLFDFRPDWHSAALLAIVILLVLLRFRFLKSAYFRDRPMIGYALAGGLALLAVLLMMHQGV
ncbi:hypothetical protein BCL74_1584 [Oceanibaculum indicum]|uniref:Uncharacterized protein n=1 Tax=Oceanibaculum indicum TaxID=526216 RepID=A0A420WRY9_9PROT|nr:hypothetical protein BCL74_1584 [Oceanibaculum indicum]